ncbi:MAG: hypothetical protein N3D85_01600 [Candidatus Bathyarchaeota archaeon]|nr:hypothetical protein [Candidatus Bathyarchaeota archaeon]
MEPQFKKFHFQEIDHIVYFPVGNNSGKYINYKVIVVDRKTATQPDEKWIRLGDFLESPLVEQRYPHTIGYFKVSSGEGINFKPEYLELREIRSIEEFWLFLNAVNL